MTTKAQRNTTTAHQSELAIDPLCTQLAGLHLGYVLQHYEALATEAVAQHWSHVDYLAHLIEGEAHRREDRSIARRGALARLPGLNKLDQLEWHWPSNINLLPI